MDATGNKPTNIRWLVFGLSCFTSWFLYIHRYAWGAIKKDVADEFDFSKTELGWLDSCFSFSYAAGQVPGGWLGDLFGPATLLAIIVAGWSLCLATMYFNNGFVMFAGTRLGFGALQAGAYPNLGKITKNWFPARIRTTVQGFIASFSGRMGGACAQFIIPTVMLGYLALSWRSTLVILAAVGLLLALILRMCLRNDPKEHSWANEAEAELVRDGVEVTGAKIPTRFARNRLAWISFSALLFHMFTSAFADQIYLNWMPMFLEESKGLPKTELGIYAALPLIGGAFGGMCGGVLNDVLRRRVGLRWARRIVGGAGKLIAGGIVVYSLTFEDGRTMMLVITVAKFFTDWSQPTVWGAVTDIAGRDTGRIFGIVNMVGSIGGIVAGPTLGAIIDHIGWGALFATIAGLYLASGAVWLLINSECPIVEDDTETAG